MTEEIPVRALVYEGDPEEDVFSRLLVVVSLGDSVLDLLKAFKAAIQSDSDYDGWKVMTVWKVRSYPYFYPTIRVENAIS
jgi:hypothetical protein